MKYPSPYQTLNANIFLSAAEKVENSTGIYGCCTALSDLATAIYDGTYVESIVQEVSDKEVELTEMFETWYHPRHTLKVERSHQWGSHWMEDEEDPVNYDEKLLKNRRVLAMCFMAYLCEINEPTPGE